HTRFSRDWSSDVCSSDLIVTLSMGAFADQAFYEDVAKTAKKYGTKVHIASGAIGGLDVLRTASLMGKCEASFQTEKSPNSLRKRSEERRVGKDKSSSATG